MPNIGNTDVTGWSREEASENYFIGTEVTMPAEAGTVASVSVRCRETTTNNAHSVWAMVYDTSGNLVDISSCRSDITTTENWYTFTGFSGATLSASTSYRVEVAIGGGSGSFRIRADDGSGTYRNNSPGDLPNASCGAFTPDDPATLSSVGDYKLGIYLTYDAVAGDTNIDCALAEIDVVGYQATIDTATTVACSFSEAELTAFAAEVSASFLPRYGSRKCEIKIQFSQVPSDQTHFPILLTAACLPSESLDADGLYHMQTDGGDLQFYFSSDPATGSDGRLNLEVVGVSLDNNPANSKVELYVSSPDLTISSSGYTSIWMFYHDSGKSQPAASAIGGSQGVWDSNYKFVYHLAEAQNTNAGGYKDSTANAYHGTGTSMSATATTGLYQGTSTAFDGSNDRIDATPSPFPLSVPPFTLFIIANKIDNSAANMTFASIGGASIEYYHALRTGTNAVAALTFNGSFYASSGAEPNYNQWNWMTGAWASTSNRKLFLNGSFASPSTSTASFTSDRLSIGVSADSSPFGFDNIYIEELRASIVARSDDWITTEYNNTSNPSAFAIAQTPSSVATEIECGLGVIALTAYITSTQNAVIVACALGEVESTSYQADVQFTTTVDCALQLIVVEGLTGTIELGGTLIECVLSEVEAASYSASIVAEIAVDCGLSDINVTGLTAEITTTKVVDTNATVVEVEGLQGSVNNDTTVNCDTASLLSTTFAVTITNAVTVNCAKQSIYVNQFATVVTRARALTAIKAIPPKVPLQNIPDVSGIADKKTREVLTAIKQNFDVLKPDTRAGNELDTLVTYRDLWQSGLAALSAGGSLTNFIGVGGGPVAPPIPPAADTENQIDLSIPPPITGVEAIGALANILVTWNESGHPQVDHYEVWRSSLDDLSQAILVGTTGATIFADELGEGGLTRYYWVRVVTQALKISQFNATEGTEGTTGLVQEGDISDGAVTRLKIGLAAIDDARIANLSAAKVTFGTMSGDRITINTLVGNRLKVNTVDGNVIIARSMAANAIAANSITSAECAAGFITAGSALIANAAVGTLQIQGNAVTVPVGAAASNVVYFYTDEVVCTSISANFEGAPVAVTAIVDLLVFGAGFPVIGAIRIRRNGALMQSDSLTVIPNGVPVHKRCFFHFVDNPGVGLTIYSITGQVSYNEFASVTYRAIDALGLKR